MKKFIFALSAIALLAVVASCGKDHQCKCTYVDGQDAVNALDILVVDAGIRCEDITEFAYEEHTTTPDGVQTLHHVEVHKVICRDYGD